MKEYRVAVVGATGLVGRTFLQVLEERGLPVKEYGLFASEKSAGKKLRFMGEEHTVQALSPGCLDGYHMALFSAGGAVSRQFAPQAAAAGCTVIDNSSAFRMEPHVPLVVPEVNPEALRDHRGIIANPNCSTIQAVVALAPLHKAYRITRIVFSTYQAVSGAGQRGLDDLENALQAYPSAPAAPLTKFPHPIFDNCLPHIDVFLPDGSTKEEEKMVRETRKILGDDTLAITATTVRVPVRNAHSEAINIAFEKPYELEEARSLLAAAPGIVLRDNVSENIYPLAAEASGRNEVFVGRLRRDNSLPSAMNLFVVADNLRKGAALNAVQIAETLIAMDRVAPVRGCEI